MKLPHKAVSLLREPLINKTQKLALKEEQLRRSNNDYWKNESPNTSKRHIDKIGNTDVQTKTVQSDLRKNYQTSGEL